MATLILRIISSLVQFSDIDGLVAQAVAVAGDPAVTEDVIRAGILVGAVLGLLLVALEALFIWFAWKGRNWARIVLIVLGGLSAVFGLAGLGTATASTGFLDSLDRKSTRLNSSHANISYGVFCLKKKSGKI